MAFMYRKMAFPYKMKILISSKKGRPKTAHESLPSGLSEWVIIHRWTGLWFKGCHHKYQGSQDLLLELVQPLGLPAILSRGRYR